MSIRKVPVKNRERAMAFYSALPGIQAQHSNILSFEEYDCDAASLLCFDVAHHFEEALAFVWSNGGRILDPELLDVGSDRCAYVLDCEGNTVALYARAV